MIATILLLFFIAIIVICIIILAKTNTKRRKPNGVTDYSKSPNGRKNTNKLVTAILSCSILGGVLLPGSFHQVEAGQVAVVKSLGKVVGTRYPGTHFDLFLLNEYTYFDTTVQKLDIVTTSYSWDAQTMEISVTLQYKIDPTKVENILLEYINMDSLAARIEKVADDKAKSVLSKYTAMKIIETRASISPEVERIIKESVGDKYYVTVTAVNLTNIEFTDEFEKAVEDKVVAEQQKEAAITKAEQELEVAKLTAQAKIEEARGDAESQKIIASASAEAMALKIIELAKSIGFTVNESYVKKTITEVYDNTTKSLLSSNTKEEVTTIKPEEKVNITVSEDKKTYTQETITISETQYSIVYDETHTKEDLKIVMDFVEYLEYLEKWDGNLPTVVSSPNGLDIIVPSQK